MDSSEPQSLNGIVQEIIEWAEQPPIETWRRYKANGKKKRIYRPKIPCSLLDLRVLHEFVSIPGVDSEFIAAQMSERLWHNEAWDCRFKYNNFRKVSKVVALLLMDLKEVFRVPKLQRDDDGQNGTLKKRVPIAGFVDLLAKLLINKVEYSTRGVQEVMKELRYLVNIFWDKPFQATEHVLVQSLLAQFEELLNQTGGFVYSLIFLSDHQVSDRIHKDLREPISLLKNNVVVFLCTMPELFISKVIYRDVDSLFIVESLLYDLKDFLNRSDARIVEVKDIIETLHNRLTFSWSSVREHSEVDKFKETGIEIRDAVYEAEYLINSFLVGHVPAWYLTINLSNIICRIDVIGTKIEEIKSNCDVKALKDEISSDAELSQEHRAGIVVDDKIAVCLEEEETNILKLLFGNEEKLQYICIFGTPGLGKTTLAKNLCYSLSVRDQFHKRSWCVVSQTYTRKKLLRSIFNDVFEDDVEMKTDEEELALQIYHALFGWRYLIVLDDVWDSSMWDDLRKYFPDNGNGSRILFTTRNRDVAPDGSLSHTLPLWSEHQCWELLEKKVFGNGTCPSELQEVGNQIAVNCKGLPLVVVVVASILSTINKEPSTWEVVAQDIGSYISSTQNTLAMQILQLSYKHLPKYLKPCFLCFGVFPKGTEIPVKKLVHLWIAEGFIHSEKKRAENIAEDYFKELVNKSLVTISRKRSDGRAKACVIHDLLHDMCLRVAEQENFLKETYANHPMRMKLQFSSPYIQPYGPWLRSFYCHIPYECISVINMKLLRVLDCWASWWYGDSSFDLVGLEHLANLRYLAARRMPKSIDSLVSLEYLIVDGEVCISSLVLKVVKLRYLKAPRLFFDHSCVSSQKDTLEFLSCVHIHNHRDVWLLKDYPQLRRLKCRYDMPAEDVPLQCFDVNFLTQLKSLSIYSFVISEIRYPVNIKKLTLRGRFNFSDEKMSTLGKLRNLEVLKLVYCTFMEERWGTRDGEFEELKFLKLDSVNLVQWDVPLSDHFRVLQQLVLRRCKSLKTIPDEMVYINTLKLIDVLGCQPSVGKSAKQIQEQKVDLGNEDLTVIVRE